MDHTSVGGPRYSLEGKRGEKVGEKKGKWVKMVKNG